MKVKQMKNAKGYAVTNQFVLEGERRIAFQSYESMIAEVDFDTHEIIIGKDYDYSTTTSRYRNIFFKNYAGIPELADLTALRKAIKEGQFRNWTVKEEDV